MIALGIPTLNRPDCLAQTLAGVREHLMEVVDRVYVHNDGSDARYRSDYWKAYHELDDLTLQHDPVNRGVAYAKNRLLEQMLEDGATWLFLLEDDILPRSDRAITGYLDACETSGWQHLNYAHHGMANKDGPLWSANGVSAYYNYVGAFSVYSRAAVESAGLMDEGFVNAFEHIEYTVRLSKLGFTYPKPWNVIDAAGSQTWLTEISTTSVIRHDQRFRDAVERGFEYWREVHPDTYVMLWPEHAKSLQTA